MKARFAYVLLVSACLGCGGKDSEEPTPELTCSDTYRMAFDRLQGATRAAKSNPNEYTIRELDRICRELRTSFGSEQCSNENNNARFEFSKFDSNCKEASDAVAQMNMPEPTPMPVPTPDPNLPPGSTPNPLPTPGAPPPIEIPTTPEDDSDDIDMDEEVSDIPAYRIRLKVVNNRHVMALKSRKYAMNGVVADLEYHMFANDKGLMCTIPSPRAPVVRSSPVAMIYERRAHSSEGTLTLSVAAMEPALSLHCIKLGGKKRIKARELQRALQGVIEVSVH